MYQEVDGTAPSEMSDASAHEHWDPQRLGESDTEIMCEVSYRMLPQFRVVPGFRLRSSMSRVSRLEIHYESFREQCLRAVYVRSSPSHCHSHDHRFG